jgi:outer membrane PBP1 activator LpoA protein
MVREDLQSYWPQRSPLFRFYGMGFDAYELIPSLYAGDGTSLTMRGMSGDLALDSQGRIRRVNLPLAQFRSGRPVAFEVAAPEPIDSSGLIGQR